MSDQELGSFPNGLRAPEDLEGASPGLELYGEVEELFLAADRKGVIDVPAEDPKDARQGRANLVRTPVLVEWLWMLGYLPRRTLSEDNAGRVSLGEGVRRFQSGAGLTVDGWAGEQTWRALQQLVTFETATRVDRWLVDGEPRAALVRAIRTRLYGLGLLQSKPTAAVAHDVIPPRALNSFWRLARRLGIVDLNATSSSVAEIATLLFDADTITSSVARSVKANGTQFTFVLVDGETRRQANIEVQAFICALAGIELWMLGFSVDVTRPTIIKVAGLGSVGKARRATQRKQKESRKRLKTALKVFRESLGGRRKKRLPVDKISPQLLALLANPDLAGVGRRFTESDFSREAARQISSNVLIGEAYAHGKSLGARLWDGLRRLWRWIKRGIKAVLQVGKNLLRGFYRFALKAHEIVRFSARTVASACRQYIKKQVNFPEGNRIKARIYRDGDLKVRLPCGAGDDELRAGANTLRYFGDAVYFSTRMLSILVRVIIKGLKATAGKVTGWARLLWVLVQSYRELRPLYRELRDSRTPEGVRPLYLQPTP